MATAVCSCCAQPSDAGTVHLLAKGDVRVCPNCLNWLVLQRDRQIAARGGGWVVTGVEPIFEVGDVARSIDHYQRLGFDTSSHDEGYAFARRERDLCIHLTRPEHDVAPRASTLYVHCDDAEALAGEWRRAGLEVSGPLDYDYGKREGVHVDPDGNRLRFGSPLPRT